MKNDALYHLAAALLLLLLALGWLLAPPKTHAQKNRSLNINFSGDAERCADLKVSSNGEVAQANESLALSKAEAPTLEINGTERGLIRVRGWDRPDYSVETCKIAVAETRAAAEQAVRGISVTRTAGRLSYSGPTGDDANWQVYFIVQTPKDANLSLETRNGPISIRGVSGTAKVRATNGPVSVRDSTGNLEIHTSNGPISFAGGGGDVHLMAQNGPISLDLAGVGEVWNGSKLDARTVNGPISLSIPEKFRSGVRVETSGHSPISCGAGACQGAWTNTSGNQRVIQMNGSQETIRVSTTNGPVSVKGPGRGRLI
jgi:hypothetical protein